MFMIHRAAAVFTFLIFGLNGFSQSSVAEGRRSPLEVTASLSNVDGVARRLMLSVRNISDKNILAYTVRLHCTNPVTGGAMVSRGYSTVLAELGGTPHYLRPGQVKTSPRPAMLPVAHGVVAQYTIDFDVVVFEDGSHWGAATSAGAKATLTRSASLVRK